MVDDFDEIIARAARIADLVHPPQRKDTHMTEETALAIMTPLIKADVLEAIEKAGGLVAAIAESAVANADQLQTMGGLRVEAQTALTTLEAKKKDLLAPMKEAQDRLREFFAPPIKALESAKIESGQKMTTYRQVVADAERKQRAEIERRERAKREAAIAKLREKAEKEKAKGHEQTAAALRDSAREQARAPVSTPPPKFTETKTEGTHFKKTYIVHIDSDAVMASLVEAIRLYNAAETTPPMLGAECFTINEKLIQKMADATKGAVPIPDVRIELVEVPITRRRR